MPSNAQCFSCKETVDVAESQLIRTKNQRLRLAGKCAKCGKSVSQFVADPDRPQLTVEEKKAREEKRREDRKAKKQLQPESPKKKIQKRSIKPCAYCSCKQHDSLLAEQPKKKKRVSRTQKLQAEVERLNSLLQKQDDEVAEIQEELMAEGSL